MRSLFKIGWVISDEFFKRQIKDNQEKQIFIDNVWDKNSKSLKNIKKIKDNIAKIPKKAKNSAKSKPIYLITLRFNPQKPKFRLHIYSS